MAGNKPKYSLSRLLLVRLVSFLGPLVIRLLGWTWRVDWKGEEKAEEIRVKGGRMLYAFWHRGLLSLAYVYRNRGVRVMISSHADGELLAATVKKMGFIPIRGSSTKGGMRAAREFSKDESINDLALTPDGPRGPKMIAQPGAVYIASRGGFYLIPIAVDASSKWELNSWDSFVIPKPFCRLKVLAGEPILLDKGLNGSKINEYSKILEKKINELSGILRDELING
ncbi:MAG: lysophospholipid acyltransferase family protein [candidate division Zixibacteria bacterium]|nr:lysophospholipid acyltransferase family protein [candidate division Zixibacteria bacterium]